MGAALWGIWDARRPLSARPETRRKRAVEAVGFLGASLLPDLDAVPGVLTGDLHSFHNQEMHSFAAGLAFALLFAFLFGRRRRVHFSVPVFWITLISHTFHLLMDAVTYGRGLRLFWPIHSGRFPPPVEVFGGLRWSEGIWYAGHWITVIEELAFAAILLGLVGLFRKKYAFQLKNSNPAV